MNNVQEILIDGKKYKIDVTIGAIKVTPVDTPTPIPDPDPQVDPSKQGTIKQGEKWSTNPGKAETWTLKTMDKDASLYKFLSTNDNKNVIADLPSEKVALQVQEYFKTHPFPPTDNPDPTPTPTPTPEPTPDPQPQPDTKETDSFGVKKIYPDADSKRFLTNNEIEPKIRHYASGGPDDNSIENTINTNDKKFRDMEATTIIVNKGMEHHDRFSYKLRGGDHKDGQGWWYIFETSTDGKWTNESFQTEKPHPKYFKHGDKIKPVAPIGKNDLRSATIGIKAITINRTVNGKEAVHLEQWLNHDPITADGKPNNAGWFKHMEVDDVGQFENGLMLECQGTNVTMRIDGILSIKDKAKMPEFFFTSVREIKNP